MKKFLLILLAILMLFAAGCKSEPKPESSESSVPAPSVPESSEASESEPSRPELPPEESYETLPEDSGLKKLCELFLIYINIALHNFPILNCRR